MRRRAPALIVATTLALGLAACGSATATPSDTAASPSGSSAASEGSAAPSAAGSSGGSSLPSGGAASPAIAIDASLLDILPAQLDGLDRQRDPSIDAGAFSDPTLRDIATGGATALYIDPPTAQFAYVAVVRLTEPLTDARFRDWRDTFDVGACTQAGGVGGHAQATIGGHDTYIGTCTGGLITYHTILVSRGLLVSISSVGDRRLGEQLVKALPS